MSTSIERSRHRGPEIEDLVDRAPELLPDERRAFVRDRCGDDAWPGQQVLALLANCDPADGVLDGPVYDHAHEALSGLVERLGMEDSSDGRSRRRFWRFTIQ